ncbi:MAG: topoisomerase DNA-binding C4 zinc finger domain-containing protein, partial [Mitsuokella jalaludinii]|nr:topoisomerase DNA-binding C4 zinc finger domain-containing protein [Mitsuokella jalaludinii]
ARMEADEKSYAAQQKDASWQSWADKPKYSASPMEHMEKDVASSSFLCPRCREGHLRSIHGKNGVFWGCSNYPRCTATFDDDHGKPLLK